MTLLIGLFLNFNMAMASDFPGCTTWEQERGVSCVFAGGDAKVWKRDCSAAKEEYQCRRGPGNLPPQSVCLSETVCSKVSPSHFEADCSPWQKERGVQCGINDRPTVWRRVCQWELLATTACTKYRKSYPTEDDYIH